MNPIQCNDIVQKIQISTSDIVDIHRNKQASTIYGIGYRQIDVDDIYAGNGYTIIYFSREANNPKFFHDMLYSAVAMLAISDTTMFSFESSVDYPNFDKKGKTGESEFCYTIGIRDILPLINPEVAKALLSDISYRVSSYYDTINSGTKSARNI